MDIQDRRYLAQCVEQLSSSSLSGLLDIFMTKFPEEIVERKSGTSYHIDFGTLSPEAYREAKDFIKKALGDDDEFGYSEKEQNVADNLTSIAAAAAAASNSAPINKSSVNPIEKGTKKLKPDEIQETTTVKEGSIPELDTTIRYYRNDDSDQHFNFHGFEVILKSVNSGEKKPWICSSCNTTYTSKDKLIDHILRKHAKEKVHECQDCHKKFSSKHYLKEHQKRVHLFPCQECGQVFQTFELLHQHTEQSHAPRVGTCVCRKGCNVSRCSCFKLGMKCTDSCQCENCQNR